MRLTFQTVCGGDYVTTIQHLKTQNNVDVGRYQHIRPDLTLK